MDKLQRAVSDNPIVALACASIAGAAAYHTFCKDKPHVTITEGKKEAKQPQSEPPAIIRLRSTGRPITKKDEGFKFVEWAEQLPPSNQNDMQELLVALEGEIPTLSDLHFMSEESLKNYGLKPLTRARILEQIRKLEGSVKAHPSLALPKIDTTGNAPLNTSVLASKQDLDDVKSWEGKRVLIRVDYNVPIKDGQITDPTRITETIPTIKRVLDPQQGGTPQCITLICHWGRPAGHFNREKNTLRPCLAVLQAQLPGVNVQFLNDCVGPIVLQAQKNCKPGTVFLCENLRFHPEEAGEDVDQEGKTFKLPRERIAAFENSLSELGDIFIFEAFGVSHRKSASVTGIKIPQRVAGLLMQKELQFYSKVLNNPARPFLAIVGGAKVSDKIQVLENLLNQCDEIIIGGGMAYTFKKTLYGVKIGSSIFDEPGSQLVGAIMRKANERNIKVHLPVDHIIADKFSPDANYGVTDDQLGIPDGWMALDVGPVTRGLNREVILRAKTVLWNGPLGVFEFGPFAGGTLSAMVHLAQASKNGAVTVIGGGDTGAASQKFYYGEKPISEQMSHVSTGGGSSLVLMEGKMLPAVPALSDKVGSSSSASSAAPSEKAVVEKGAEKAGKKSKESKE